MRHFYLRSYSNVARTGQANQELEVQFTRLAEPFDPSDIKWRVTDTNKDGTRGAVIACADPRAYTDRLNLLFTPTGWTRAYEVTAVSSVTRTKKDKLIQTGKVLVTCILMITGLGRHSGSGEEWADEENAMTAAEAQVFKRASSGFGLGRYLYNLAEIWVPLNEYRQPIQFPVVMLKHRSTGICFVGHPHLNFGIGIREPRGQHTAMSARYLHLSQRHLQSVSNPLERLQLSSASRVSHEYHRKTDK